MTESSVKLPQAPPIRPELLSNTSSTEARPAGLRSDEPLKITSCIDSPRNSDAFDSPSTQRTASMMLDLPQPLGPTTPTSCPGISNAVGSTNDLKPESLICLRRTQTTPHTWPARRQKSEKPWPRAAPQSWLHRPYNSAHYTPRFVRPRALRRVRAARSAGVARLEAAHALDTDRRTETFANPHPGRDYRVHLDIPEFTCLCPLTGQPDFARFRIDYVPDRRNVELKSLKQYMWSFRDQGAFHEAVTNRILDDADRGAGPALHSRERALVRPWRHLHHRSRRTPQTWLETGGGGRSGSDRRPVEHVE